MDFTEYYEALDNLKWVTIDASCFEHAQEQYQFVRDGGSYNHVNLWNDSFIIAPVGSRGSGKTTLAAAMSIQGKWLWPDIRIISNFPIKWQVKNSKGKLVKYQAEPLDLVSMVTFESDYKHALILIDECPQILNRMNASSNRNKFLNLWIQQLRKNRNSLVLCSQGFGYVDHEAGGQVDIIINCKDASRRYPQSGLKRGGVVLMDLQDHSGLWTGYSFDERPKYYKMRMLSEYVWDTFDTYYTIDILDQLWRLEVQRGTHTIGREPESPAYLEQVADMLVLAAQGMASVSCEEVFSSSGITTQAKKTEIGKRLGAIGCSRVRVGNDWHYPLNSFEKNIFLK